MKCVVLAGARLSRWVRGGPPYRVSVVGVHRVQQRLRIGLELVGDDQQRYGSSERFRVGLSEAFGAPPSPSRVDICRREGTIAREGRGAPPGRLIAVQ